MCLHAHGLFQPPAGGGSEKRGSVVSKVKVRIEDPAVMGAYVKGKRGDVVDVDEHLAASARQAPEADA